MQDLKVLLVQNDTVWHDPDANRDNLEKLIGSSETDLIVLPEMFSTGFTMESSEVAEDMGGDTVSWLAQMAEASNAAICGSIVIQEDEHYYNRFIWVSPNGELTTYDKRHLFRMADEHDHYSSGSNNIIIEYLGWKIRPQICYDLRFPVWARNRLIDNDHEYDILINVANWPEPRVTAWDTLLKARAIENHAYAIGVNRIGIDGKGVKYCGHSAVYDPKGNAVCHLEDKLVAYATNLDYEELKRYRSRFPAQLDADDFEIKT